MVFRGSSLSFVVQFEVIRGFLESKYFSVAVKEELFCVMSCVDVTSSNEETHFIQD